MVRSAEQRTGRIADWRTQEPRISGIRASSGKSNQVSSNRIR